MTGIYRTADIRASMPLTFWLAQTERWTDAEGNEWRLEDMTPRHRANALRYLRRRAESLHTQASMEWLRSPLALSGEGAGDEADFWADDDAEKWLEEQPLVKRLVELSFQQTEGTAT